MKNKLSNFSTQQLIGTIMRFAAIIIFILAAALLCYLAFVQNINISPNIRNVTLIAAISIVLNVIVWEMYYRDGYNKVFKQDLENESYSIHKRYYLARKGYKYDELQQKIAMFNHSYKRAWINDVCELCGRSEQEIVNGPYKGFDHKILIWKLKHRKYPKSGIKNARQLLSMLSVGNSGTMKISIKKAERMHAVNMATKIVTSLAGMFMAASVLITFIDGDWQSAIFRLLMYIAMLCTSLFTGTMTGINSAKSKLSVTEEVCEKLEEWKDMVVTEVPYKEKEEVKIETVPSEKKIEPKIELV